MATARLCVANAMDGAGRPARDLVIPHCTYTDPEVATVGLTPVRAAEEGVALDTHQRQWRRLVDWQESVINFLMASQPSFSLATAREAFRPEESLRVTRRDLSCVRLPEL
jgi:hypothetical protein